MEHHQLSGSNRCKKLILKRTKWSTTTAQTDTTTWTILQLLKPFRPLQQIEGYDPHYIDPEYGVDPYWDNSFYDQRIWQVKCDNYPLTDDENDPEIPDNNLSRALIELWQPNSEITNDQEIEELITENGLQSESGLIDESAFLHDLITKEGEPAYIPLSTNLGLK